MFLRIGRGTLGIPRFTLGKLSVAERRKLLQTETDEQGHLAFAFYRYSSGEPILDEKGAKIPVPRNLNKLPLQFITDGRVADQGALAQVLERYIREPYLISDDGHTLTKHGIDAILAMEVITYPEYGARPFYRPKGDQNPETLIHTWIAKEIADSIRDKIKKTNPARNRELGANVRSWIRGFAADDPILAVMLYNEIKYLLKYNYNLDYDAKREYANDDVDTVLPFEGIKEIIRDQGLYTQTYMRRIHMIFSHRDPIDRSTLSRFYPFESKIDECIRYLQTEQRVRQESLRNIIASGHFDRYYRPVVILGSIEDMGRDGNTRLYPTGTVVTAYTQEYNTHRFSCINDLVVSPNPNRLEKSGQRARELQRKVLEQEGDYATSLGIRNVHILHDSYIWSIITKIQGQLRLGNAELQKYLEITVALRDSHRY